MGDWCERSGRLCLKDTRRYHKEILAGEDAVMETND